MITWTLAMGLLLLPLALLVGDTKVPLLGAWLAAITVGLAGVDRRLAWLPGAAAEVAAFALGARLSAAEPISYLLSITPPAELIAAAAATAAALTLYVVRDRDSTFSV